MASFAILLFFAVTGLTLNHQDWFNGQQTARQYHGVMQAKWVNGEAAKLEIVKQLRRAHHIQAALSDFRVDDAQCEVSFKGPGYEADTFIDRQTGRYEVTETRQGFVAILNDLHKGRDSGKAWSIVVDLSALLMTLVSLTGFTLIFFLQKRRSWGLLLFAIGGLVFYLIYLFFVP
jgi:hypothetical protein